MTSADPSRSLVQGETYVLAVLAPTSWTSADVVSAMSTRPPGLSPGTFQVSTVEPGAVSGQYGSWHVTGKWYGPEAQVPDSAGPLLYPAVVRLRPDEPLPASTSTILWPPDGYDDVANRTLSTGRHYVFVLLTTSTEDQALAYLSYSGWDLRSFSNPPAAISDELLTLYKSGYSSVPNVWIVNAFWQGPDGYVLPAQAGDRAHGQFRYVAVAEERLVPYGPPAPTSAESSPSPWGPVVATILVGAAVLGGLWVARRSVARLNPAPSNRIVVEGVEFFTYRDGDGYWCAPGIFSYPTYNKKDPVRIVDRTTCGRTRQKLVDRLREDVRDMRHQWTLFEKWKIEEAARGPVGSDR